MEGTDEKAKTEGSKEYPLDVMEEMGKTVEGLIMPAVFPTEHIISAMNFRPRDNDIVLATYPKSGTTWTTYIVANLLYFDQYGPESTFPLPTVVCPFIDMEGLEKLRDGGPLKTHLPFDPKRFNPRAKYIVVLRNPRDVCVSYYHHTTFMIPGAQEKPKGFWFPAFAKMFISNQTWYEDYFKHVLSWLEGPTAAGGDGSNVLYVIYEKMKVHPREELIRIANFIGGEVAERVKDEKVVDEILLRTSVQKMKKELNPVIAKNLQSMCKPEDVKKLPTEVEFVRKGEIGDWKNHFTPEISAEFDAWIQANPENEKVMKLFEI